MFWWIIQNSAIAGLMAGCVSVCCRWLRIAPVGRHALWVIVLIKLVTPPLVAWPWQVRDPLAGVKSALAAQPSAAPQITSAAPSPSVPIAPPTTSEPPTGVLPGDGIIADADANVDQFRPVDQVPTPPAIPPPATIITAKPAEQSPAIQWRSWRIAAVAAWAIGTVVFAMIQCIRIVRMLRLIRRAQPAPAALVRQAGELARRLGVGPIPILVVPGIASPAIWALGRPVLLWPDGLGTGRCESAAAGLLVHELAHVRRRDHWVGWLELLAGCAWWWNPLFWYVRHQVRENAELACDAWVVDVLPRGRRAYAEALLAVCEYFTGQTIPTPAVGARTGGRRLLERRLAMILKDTFPQRLGKFRLLAVGLIGLITLPAWSQRPPDASPPQPGTEPENVFIKRTRVTDKWVEDGVATTGEMAITPDGDYLAVEVSPLPPMAREVMSRYQAEKAAVQRETAARIASSRENAVRQLEQILPLLDQSGAAAQARAVRGLIKRLQAEGGGVAVQRALPDPGTLTAYRDHVGHRFFFLVTGSDQGQIWGSTVYSDDSPLAVASVHAGLLKVGQRGVVRVTILPGMESYDGSSRNGVASQSYEAWPGSYLVEAVPPEPLTDEIRLLSPGPLRATNHVTTRWRVLPGTPGGPGMAPGNPGMPPGGPGTVPGGPAAPGSGAMPGGPGTALPPGGPSVPPPGAVPPVQNPGEPKPSAPGLVPPPAPDAVSTPNGEEVGAGLAIGDKFMISLTGSYNGNVWGNKIYTTDSSLAAAAVHAGVLKEGELGKIIVTILPGQDSYEGTTSNGVTSEPWHSFGRSFKVEPAPAHGPVFGGPGAGAGGR